MVAAESIFTTTVGSLAQPRGETRPDYGHDGVRYYILDSVLMWLEEYHVDGLEFD